MAEESLSVSAKGRTMNSKEEHITLERENSTSDITIKLSDVGKRYNLEWIFKGVSKSFSAPHIYAITGANGSGKSTLLQVIAGAVLHSKGTISYKFGKTDIEEPFKNIVIAAPYLELIEEMTATEYLQFHQKFKSLTASISKILETVGLAAATNKQIRYYSSGMKQRLKLAQAFYSDSKILLLDEPTTNLDEAGILLFENLLQNQRNNRCVIISSNNAREYAAAGSVISIETYKL